MSGKQSGKETSQILQPELARTLLATIQERDAGLGRVARLLHDEVSQVLSAVGLQLDALKMDFAEQVPEIEQRATEIQNMLEQVIEQLRDISNELNPSIVERAGLQFALDRLAGRMRRSFSGNLRLHLDPTVHVPTAAAVTFYKIAESAIESAIGRPNCTLIELSLRRSRGAFILDVRDNASISDADPKDLPLPRLLLDYYASRGQVALEIEEAPDRGNLIRASFPAPDEIPKAAS